MWCCKCNNDLSECICPDIVERLESLRKCPHIHAPSVVDKPLDAIAARREKEQHDRAKEPK